MPLYHSVSAGRSDPSSYGLQAAASKVRGAENKRERADKDTLEQVLFNLFEAQVRAVLAADLTICSYSREQVHVAQASHHVAIWAGAETSLGL